MTAYTSGRIASMAGAIAAAATMRPAAQGRLERAAPAARAAPGAGREERAR